MKKNLILIICCFTKSLSLVAGGACSMQSNVQDETDQQPTSVIDHEMVETRQKLAHMVANLSTPLLNACAQGDRLPPCVPRDLHIYFLQLVQEQLEKTPRKEQIKKIEDDEKEIQHYRDDQRIQQMRLRARSYHKKRMTMKHAMQSGCYSRGKSMIRRMSGRSPRRLSESKEQLVKAALDRLNQPAAIPENFVPGQVN